MRKRPYITGGGGFIGSAAVQHILQRLIITFAQRRNPLGVVT
jgi:nucleoside-diphosphate-sugar epimerase